MPGPALPSVSPRFSPADHAPALPSRFARRLLGPLSLAAALTCAPLGSARQAPAGAPTLLRSATGQVYLADQGRILQLDTVQQRLRAVTPDISARQLLLDSEKNVYAPSMRYDPRADLYRPTLWRYSPGGGVSEARATAEASPFTFSDLVDADGTLFFWQVDGTRRLSRILIRAKDTPPALLAGHAWGVRDGRGAEAQFSRLGGMALGPDGQLFVCDDQCVRRVARDGTVTTVARGGLLSLGAGRGAENHLGALAVGTGGDLFVADRVTGRILRVDAGGIVTTHAYTEENWRLASLAWADDALYVLESGPDGNRVIRLDAEGSRHPLPRTAPAEEPAALPPGLRVGGTGPVELLSPLRPMFLPPFSLHPDLP